MHSLIKSTTHLTNIALTERQEANKIRIQFNIRFNSYSMLKVLETNTSIIKLNNVKTKGVLL